MRSPPYSPEVVLALSRDGRLVFAGGRRVGRGAAVRGFSPRAVGGRAGGAGLHGVGARGGPPLGASRGLLCLYAGGGLALPPLYPRLAPDRRSTSPPPLFGLHRSRGVVLELAALQSVDALAGGFIVQALLPYWFHLRLGAGPAVLGPRLFATN